LQWSLLVKGGLLDGDHFDWFSELAFRTIDHLQISASGEVSHFDIWYGGTLPLGGCPGIKGIPYLDPFVSIHLLGKIWGAPLGLTVEENEKPGTSLSPESPRTLLWPDYQFGGNGIAHTRRKFACLCFPLVIIQYEKVVERV
jgi:hypothetical protein